MLLRGEDVRAEGHGRRVSPSKALLDRWVRDPLRRDVLFSVARAVGSGTGATARSMDRQSVEGVVVDGLLRAFRDGVVVALHFPDDTLGRIRPLSVPPPLPPPPPPPPAPPVNPVVAVAQPVVLVKHEALNPRRCAVRLGTDGAFDGTGTLTVSGGGRVRFFDAPTGGNEVPLDGSVGTFPGTRLSSGVFLYAEGVSASTALHDVRITLSLSGGSRPTGPDATGTLTVLEVLLEIHQSRRERDTLPAVLSRADKVVVGRFVHKQHGEQHGRAMVTLRKARPHGYNGDLRLEGLSDAIKLFDAEHGGSEVSLPHIVGNGMIPVAPRDGVVFWLEGVAVSAALRDTGLRVGAEGDMEGDLVRVTVVEFREIRASVPQTPPFTARMGNGPVPDAVFAHGAVPGAADYDPSPTVNAPLVLVENSIVATAPVRLDVRVLPPDVPVKWAVHRDNRPAPEGDHPNVVACSPRATPTLIPDGTDPLAATLLADAVGTFHVRPYVDCNGSGDYEHGIDREPCALLNVVLVRATLFRDRTETHNTLTATPALRGISVRSGSFDLGAPAGEAIHMNAEIDLVGGGWDGRRGTDQVFAGWVNNESQDENIVGTFVDRTVSPPVVLHVRSVFAANRDVATGGTANSSVFLPFDPAPVLVAPPLLDTGRPNPGSGGNTATLTRSRLTSRRNLPVGQRLHVEAVDSPGDGEGSTHPARPNARLERFHFELDFRASLCVWVNQANSIGATGDPSDRLYAVVLEVPWRMRGEWAVDPTTGALTVRTAPTVSKGVVTVHRPAAPVARTAIEVRPPTGLSLLARDAQ